MRLQKPSQPYIFKKYPPKYEYNYYVANRKDQASQGHREARSGINTAGNYYVNLPEGQSKHHVTYVADDWGFHPIVRYGIRLCSRIEISCFPLLWNFEYF